MHFRQTIMERVFKYFTFQSIVIRYPYCSNIEAHSLQYRSNTQLCFAFRGSINSSLKRLFLSYLAEAIRNFLLWFPERQPNVIRLSRPNPTAIVHDYWKLWLWCNHAPVGYMLTEHNATINYIWCRNWWEIDYNRLNFIINRYLNIINVVLTCHRLSNNKYSRNTNVILQYKI